MQAIKDLQLPDPAQLLTCQGCLLRNDPFWYHSFGNSTLCVHSGVTDCVGKSEPLEGFWTEHAAGDQGDKGLFTVMMACGTWVQGYLSGSCTWPGTAAVQYIQNISRHLLSKDSIQEHGFASHRGPIR